MEQIWYINDKRRLNMRKKAGKNMLQKWYSVVQMVQYRLHRHHSLWAVPKFPEDRQRTDDHRNRTNRSWIILIFYSFPSFSNLLFLLQSPFPSSNAPSLFLQLPPFSYLLPSSNHPFIPPTPITLSNTLLLLLLLRHVYLRLGKLKP